MSHTKHRVKKTEKSCQISESRITFPLSGDGTIHNISQLHSFINEALLATDELELDISQINKVDLSFLQLLIAVGKNNKKGHKKIFLSTPPPDHHIFKVSKLAGYEIANKRKWFGITVTKNRKAKNE